MMFPAVKVKARTHQKQDAPTLAPVQPEGEGGGVDRAEALV